MLLDFFYTVKKVGVPVSIKEFLTLMEGLQQNLAFASVDEFYQLARLCMVKDEKYFDRFDLAFAHFFHGLEEIDDLQSLLFPEDWLKSDFMKRLSEREKAEIEALGGLEKLLETLNKRLQEQQKRHQGGNKWIGTGGTSPFGHSGYNPAGIRIGGESKHNRAVKVWEQRKYQNLDDSVEIGTRSIKMALKKLRQFARSGAADELDLEHTIKATADNAGLLDLKMRPERHNAAKLLIFFDVGGSMDWHVQICQELFSAVKTEFKHLEYYYFHNCIYENLWQDNLRREQQPSPTWDVIHTYDSDYNLIIVGDAAMSPYEIMQPYGSVEHMNPESGEVWLTRVLQKWPKAVWLNPLEQRYWQHTHSTQIIKQIINDQMYPLTLQGLEQAIRHLARQHWQATTKQ